MRIDRVGARIAYGFMIVVSTASFAWAQASRAERPAAEPPMGFSPSEAQAVADWLDPSAARSPAPSGEPARPVVQQATRVHKSGSVHSGSNFHGLGGNFHGQSFHGAQGGHGQPVAPLETQGNPNFPRALPDVNGQGPDDVHAKSHGCIVCHQGATDMHMKPTVRLGCTDCHGGNADCATKQGAHVQPRFPDAWATSGNPVRTYTLLNHERPEFIRFVNPGDLRVADISCGGCHAREVLQVKKSMMTHGTMLWEAALYNNGGFPMKNARFGESYSMNGVSQRVQTIPPPSAEEMYHKGVVQYLDPLPRFEMSQPGNVLRIFERGGRFRPEVGIPESGEEGGRPRSRLSNRGLGTENRTDPVFIGLQKTRLLDPTLNFLGTNDHPGDYRSSGCTGCHVIYANDRSPIHSGPYHVFGNRGTSFSSDPTIPKDEPGHPIEHRFVKGNGVPTSQCIVCHIHPGTTVMNSYIGYMWWDEETDAELIYPREQKNPTAEEYIQAAMSNPNESSAKNRLSEPEFLANLTDLNTQTRHTVFGDFHGHGWAFRAVFKKDRQGNLLDHRGQVLPEVSNEQLRAAVEMPIHLREEYRTTGPTAKLPPPNRDHLPVHMLDIHMEKGMHCVDCHFIQDVHGNTRLQREVRAAIEIGCADCHGTADQRTTLTTSGPAAYTSGPEGYRDLSTLRTPSGKRRFERIGDKIYQNSMVEDNLRWEVKQTIDAITVGHEHYNPRAAAAKTVRFGDDGKLEWGGKHDEKCAHQNKNMSCIACHSSWNPSCFGCHLPQKANIKTPNLHNEGDVLKNLVAYNFQTLRDDVYMLARDGNVTGNRIGPARSSCAIHVGSYNGLRESIYVQQQTISADGMSGIAFSTNVPHTVRGGSGCSMRPEDFAAYRPGTSETKMCTDCHVSKNNDNNAIMAQLLMQGTNYVNFMGRYCWTACGEHGLFAVEVTERDEPQAVIGSSLHRVAFPDHFHEHVERGWQLEHAHEHPGLDIGKALLKPRKEPGILQVQARGEYLYAACGEDGFRAFDIAFIDHKGFSERITTAPVSPLGQKFHVPSKYATAVAAPTTIAPDPTRIQHPENGEQPIHGIYAYIYFTDKYEGLILVGAGTLLDGNPTNNFLERALTFNPGGLLCGARSITIVGTYAYVCCNAGLVVIDISDPLHPHVTSVIGEDLLHHPKTAQVQFRYCFVGDAQGMKVFDVTDLAQPKFVTGLELHDIHNLYVARTYAYVAAGKQGLVIVDVTNPEAPFIDQIYNANGCINDLHDVKLGITYTSEFAYLADGCHGLRVVQLTSPDTPGNSGFSPRPAPRLVATYKLPHGGHVLSVTEAVDRDRAVDESGNQIAVFGRIGARPMSLAEQQQMYLKNGQVFKVSDDPYDTDVFRPLDLPRLGRRIGPMPFPGATRR